MFKNLSLKLRLTLITAAVIAAVSIILTVTSIYNANGTWALMADSAVISFDTSEAADSFSEEAETDVERSVSITGTDFVSPENDGQSQPFVEMKPITIAIEKQRFKLNSFIYMAVIIVLGTAASYFVIGRALKPITSLSKTISGINQSNMSMRINDIYANDEVGSLAVSFNNMMDRLDESFAKQKQFSVNAAHELKTPLATIKAAIQVLNIDENPTNEDYRETIETTGKAVDRLINLVDDLLRLTDVNDESAKDAINICELFNEIRTELLYKTKSKNVSIITRNEPYEISFYGNRRLIYRAVFNVAENAVKYNRNNGKVILSCYTEEGKVFITIEDTGIGIPEKEIENIFEPLYRVDKSRNRKISGAGLGLSIVKAIIEKDGGTIKVKSSENEGTTFTLGFPLGIENGNGSNEM
ncbi:HAMP domain-containing histidine kinase [Anaerotignum faecicola]|nr:HAMP domain-containing histidine kinase [Anaerotignum faecicola]